MELTGAEFNLAALFVERPNRVLTREMIGEATHKDDWEAFDRSVDTLVSRLRRKLTRHATQANLIQTVRGEGYVLACSVKWSGVTALEPFSGIVKLRSRRSLFRDHLRTGWPNAAFKV